MLYFFPNNTVLNFAYLGTFKINAFRSKVNNSEMERGEKLQNSNYLRTLESELCPF